MPVLRYGPVVDIDSGFNAENATSATTDIKPLSSSHTNHSFPDITDYFLDESSANLTIDHDHLYNDTFLITDNPPIAFPVPQNTPLTAPESDLVTAKSYDVLSWLLRNSSGDTEDLYWLIPVVVGVVGVFIIMALLLYYGVRTLELKLIRCCRRNCGAGCCAGGSIEDEETVALTSENLVNPTELKEYKSYSSAHLD